MGKMLNFFLVFLSFLISLKSLESEKMTPVFSDFLDRSLLTDFRKTVKFSVFEFSVARN